MKRLLLLVIGAALSAKADIISPGAASSAATPAPTPIQTGLVWEYRMDEGSGTIINNARNGAGQSTNVIVNPQGAFNAAPWGKATATVTDRYGVDPTGQDGAARFEGATGTSYVSQTITLAAVQYTLSCYVASNTGAAQTVRQYTGGWSADKAIPATGWTRISTTFTPSAGAVLIAPVGNSAAGTATDLLIYGAKLEKGATATAYIPGSANMVVTGTAAWDSTGLNFNTSAYAMASVPAVSFPQVSVYAVAKWPTANTPNSSQYAGLIGSQYGSPGWTLAARQDTNGFPGMMFNGTAAANIASATLSNLKDGQWHLVAGTYDGTTIRFYVDGCELASKALSTGPTYATLIQMGTVNVSGSYTFPGIIAYASVYNVLHSGAQVDAQMSAITSLAASKGITLTARGMMAFEGDSITHGNSILPAYPNTALGATNPITQGRNFAVVSSRIGTELTARASTVDATLKTGKRNILFVLAGINDLNIDSAGAATTFNRLKTYCQNRRAAGWKVVACTLLPTTGGQNANARTVSASIRADNSFYDALCDFGADPNMGTDGAAADVSKYSDGLHPTLAGHNLLAPVAAAAIAAVP